MITLNNIVDRLSQWATNHHFIERFTEGEEEDINTGKSDSFPLMHVQFIGEDHELDENATLVTYNFDIVFADKPTDKDNARQREREIISDSAQIARDLISDLKNGFNVFVKGENYGVESSSIVPFTQEFNNNLSGVVYSIGITVPFANDSCNLPLTGVTPGSSTCADATVQTSGGNYSTTVASGGTLNIPDQEIREQDDSVIATLEAVLPTKITNANITSASVVSGVKEIEVDIPTQADILYHVVQPNQVERFVTDDTGGHVQALTYKYIAPSYPTAIALLNSAADQSSVRVTPASGTLSTDFVFPTMLANNNSFGNKFRYTDDQGNESDATVGSNLWAHVDWVNHSWTGATTGYVIDHYLGIGMDINYILDGTAYSLLNTSAGQSWADWVAHIAGLTHLTYSDWRLPSVAEAMSGAHGAKCTLGLDWANNFFNAQRSDNRCGMLTGDSESSSEFLILYDSGNDDVVVDYAKATAGGFIPGITMCMAIRTDRR